MAQACPVIGLQGDMISRYHWQGIDVQSSLLRTQSSLSVGTYFNKSPELHDRFARNNLRERENIRK